MKWSVEERRNIRLLATESLLISLLNTFYSFQDPRDAKDALKELDGTKYMDSEIRIDIARGDRKTPSEMKYKDRGGRYRDDRRDYGDRRSRRYDDDDDGYRRRDRTRSRSRNRRRRSRSRSRSDSRSVTRRRRESPKRERSNTRKSLSPVKTKSSQMGSNRDHSTHQDESSPRGNSEQGRRSRRRGSRSCSSRSRSRS